MRTRSYRSFRLALLAAMAMQAVGLSVATMAPAHAGNALLSDTIALTIPSPTPADACAAVDPAGAGKLIYIYKTFVDDFETFDLTKNTWSPNYDGGYNETTKQFLGYDWNTKRTLAGNKEQQVYVDPGYAGTAGKPLALNPFSQAKGILHIIAQRTPPELMPFLDNLPFTSGLITTRRSFVQRYGYFEMRAKLPTGTAMWPAFWLLPVDKSWPPELDIMEAPASQPDLISTTVHWLDGTTQKASGCKTKFAGFGNDFHLYGALWMADRIVYYIDRKPVAQIKTPPGVNKHMYMLVNLAVGGTWPGFADPTTPIPADMQVDWVAAYSLSQPTTCTTLANGVKQCPAQ